MHARQVGWLTLLVASLVVVYVGNAGRSRAQQAKPNILFLLADDLGYADVGFTGGTEIRTPEIDELAASGTRLTQFYVQPVCTPTRAALMTGRYPMRYGLQIAVIRPTSQFGLSLDERTLPHALREAGYVTAIDGKWHLGHFDRTYVPTRRGFDRQYGEYNGAIDYFTHIRDGELDWHRNDELVDEEGYTTHLFAREAVQFLREYDGRRPFFLYVAFNAPHQPLQVPDEYKVPYANLPEGDQRRTYAGMVAAMDEAVGQIVDALDAKGLRENTLIVFSSDNGGLNPGVISSNGPLRGQKSQLYEGGVRVPAFATWKGHLEPGTTVDAPLHMVDWYPTLLKLAGAGLDQPLPLDGRDAWPTIAEGKASPHEEILLNSTPYHGAIRVGDWKLILNGSVRVSAGEGGRGGREPGVVNEVELFNLAADPYEKTNLAESNPGKVRELRERYDALASQAVPALAEQGGRGRGGASGVEPGRR